MDSMVKINIVGDFCVKDLNTLYFGKRLRDILSLGNINIVNFEAPIYCEGSKPIKKSGPHLFQDKGAPHFLMENGFNGIVLANNHIMDYGEAAFIQTKKAFHEVYCFGAGTFNEAYKIEKIHTEHGDVGILALTQYEFGVVNEEDPNSLGSAWICHPCIDEILLQSKKECDYLVIIPHAGLENFEFPLPEIKSLYRHFIEMGADAVVGGHPHIPQGWEFYKGKPIVYSLGNFCFDAIKSLEPMWNKGLIATLTLNNDDIYLEIKKIEFNKERKEVEITENLTFDDFLIKINNTLRNPDPHCYLNTINNKCLSLESTYNLYYEMSGYYKLSIKKYIRLILGLIKRNVLRLNENSYNQSHIINCIRCETHRWVLSRIYNLQQNKL